MTKLVRAIAADDVALVIGALLIVAGAFLLAPWIGLVVAGVAFIAASYFVIGAGS